MFGAGSWSVMVIGYFGILALYTGLLLFDEYQEVDELSTESL